MKKFAVLFRSGALAVTALFSSLSPVPLRAQAPAEPASARPTAPEQLSQAELLKSYLQVREQLQATQLAIINNRVEAEAAARAQSAAITEKIEAIKTAMTVEREHQQIETQRLTAERERQAQQAANFNRTVLWVATGSGALALLAMALMPYLQWRAINRMAELAHLRPQLPGGQTAALLNGDSPALSEHAVTLSNQRLMTAIERIERKISDVEQAASQPLVAASATPSNSSDSVRRLNGNAHGNAGGPVQDQSSRITLLLGRGRSLFNTNKLLEALSCYDEILRLDLNHPETLVRKGATLERLKQDAEAIQCYDRAIAANRKMTLAYLYKGGVCNRLERYEEALQCYEQALRAEDYA